VSTLEALDISGVAASNWSQYPTLNSSILFQPAYVLSNISNKLFFAGQELTDLSGGGVDWSYFNALTDVSMNNFSVRGISTLQFQDSARLYSQTGNNLFYNGQPIQVGAGSGAPQWASYPAVSSVNMNSKNLSNAALIAGSNLTLSGSNITNGNTFTNSLGVGGTSLVSLASITSGGDLTCRNIQVGDQATSLADVNIYGATAAPGDSALYVEGGVQVDGGTIHGFSAGVLPVAGINTGRMENLTAGFNILHPVVGAITTGAALAITAGGAISMAAGGYLELNTSTLQMINTSQGNKNTTIQAGFLTVDPDVAPTSSIKLFNTLGGGVEIDGGAQGSLRGFSTLQSSNVSSINLDVSTINGVPISEIQVPSTIICSNIFVSQSTITSTLAVPQIFNSTIFYNFGIGVSTVIGAARINNIKIADDITGITNAPNPLESRIVNFSSINSFAMSTTDLWVSSINGLPVDLSGGGGPTISSFTNAQASSFHVSTLKGFPNGDSFAGSSLSIETGLQFIGYAPSIPNSTSGRWISSLRQINNLGEDFTVFASTMFFSYAAGANSNGQIRVGGGAFSDTIFREIGGVPGISTASIFAVSSVASELTLSTLKAPGGTALKVANTLEFVGLNGFNNVDIINTGGLNVPVLNINASTIVHGTANTRMTSLSTLQLSTSALNFSTAYSFQSNTAMNYPLFLEADHAGASTAASGVAILIQGHNLGTGMVRNTIEMGARANGECFIATSWPGQNLEDLYIDATDVVFRDGTFSTIVNLDPYGLITTGAISAPQLLVSSVQGLNLSTQSLFVSSINGNDARPAYTNNLMLSTMELYNASTTLMYWDSTTASSNINSSGYDVVAGVNGHYKIGASFQFISGGGANEVEFFIVKNDSVISQSGGIIEVQNNEEIIQYVESIESLVNGDKIQIGCYATGTGVYVSTINGNVIQSPAVILTMYKVD
jgi:hypothetical protein